MPTLTQKDGEAMHHSSGVSDLPQERGILLWRRVTGGRSGLGQENVAASELFPSLCVLSAQHAKVPSFTVLFYEPSGREKTDNRID